jgi:hypothetical protein
LREPGGWKQAKEAAVGPWNDVHGEDFSDAASGQLPRLRGGANSGYITTNKCRHKATANNLPPQHLNIRSLNHRIARLYGSNEAAGFNHSEGVAQEIYPMSYEDCRSV